MQSPLIRALVTGAAWAVLTVAAIVPFLFWGTDKAPEFYGAFVAAIVAAIAVVLGAFYQAELTRKRDDEIRRTEQLSEATELYYWLDHAVQELELITQILNGFRDRLIAGESKIEFPLDQLREIVSAKFMDELLLRAKTASRLPSAIAAAITETLYRTFTATDRVYKMRGAAPDFPFNLNHVEQFLFVNDRRTLKLKEARESLGQYLAGQQAKK